MKILLGKKEKNNFMIIDAEDFDKVSAYSWYKNSYGYAIATIPTAERGTKKVKRIAVHRLIINAPNGMDVDHINGDALDNRKINLRVCSRQQNLLNKKKTRGISKYKGVSWFERDKNWLSKISLNYKQYYLGYFKTEEDAAMAYDRKAQELFGEFAKLNFKYASLFTNQSPKT